MRDYPSGNSAVFDAQSGRLVDTFASGPVPAFVGRTGLFVWGGTLEARDLKTAALEWSFTGDGSLQTAPIAVNDGVRTLVYVGSGAGNLYALDLTSGQIVWQTNAGVPIPPWNEGVLEPLTGLGAGQGLLVVPAGRILVAYAKTAS